MATKTGAQPARAAKQAKAKRGKVGTSRVQERKIGRNAGGVETLRSKVTERWQTTLPSGVRKALELDAGAELRYEIRGDSVVIRKAVEEEDPVVTSFLDFLERDMRAHPENLVPVTESLVARLRALTEGVEVGRGERIEGPVAL